MRRRSFLQAGVATAGSAAVAGCAPPAPAQPPQSEEPFEGEGPFPSGVGSADPGPDRVLLWTRAHPERDPGDGIEVAVDVSRSPSFGAADLVGTLTAVARGERDHCVQVDATGLDPARTYWYRFRYDGHQSQVGRTRTAPSPDDPVDSARLAAFSCQRWTHGWFTAHADLASLAQEPQTDVDLVLCLGDYVYETGYADGVVVPGRHDPVQRAVTHDQFRSKYRMYRSDPHLQAVHALYPVVHVFDNHDGLGEPGDPQASGALAAFDEHVPLRRTVAGRIHRRLRWGRLAEIFMTDQRQFRDPGLEESGLLGTSTTERPEILDPSRSMLGADQREWLLDGLRTSSATWKVIGSQLAFWPWRSFGRLPGQPRGAGVYLNLTQWDGYAAERLAILDALAEHDVRNTLLLSGDSHVFSAAHVAPDVDDPTSMPRIAELATGSITSSNADEMGYPTDDLTWPLLRAVNPNHLRYFESERHGYVVAELTPGETTAEIRSPRTVRRPTSPVTDVLARFHIAEGTQRIRRTA